MWSMLQKSSLLLPTILMTSMVRLPPFFCELVFAVPVSDCMLRHVPDLCLITGVYANLDTITITFDKNTDKAGLAEGVVQTRATVDALFAFSQSLGFFPPLIPLARHLTSLQNVSADGPSLLTSCSLLLPARLPTLHRPYRCPGASYRGVWESSRVFVVTTLDWPGSAPPRVGPQGAVLAWLIPQAAGLEYLASRSLAPGYSSLTPKPDSDFLCCDRFDSDSSDKQRTVNDSAFAAMSISLLLLAPSFQILLPFP